MKLRTLTRNLPSWKSSALTVLSAVVLILAFPDFEFWFLAWVGLVPLLWAVDTDRESTARSFVLGWIWGFVFFSGTCWWLTFAPIAYAGFPWPIAYFLLFCLTAIVGIFPAIFAAIFSILLNRAGNTAILVAPFAWVFTEFLRYWVTGNNWNAVGYSQAFRGEIIQVASFGGVLLIGFLVLIFNGGIFWSVRRLRSGTFGAMDGFLVPALTVCLVGLALYVGTTRDIPSRSGWDAQIIAIQPNVPMAGLNYEKWLALRNRHVELSERALSESNLLVKDPKWNDSGRFTPKTIVILPESPMNFAYNDDEEFQRFVHAFAAKHDVNVLFNSAEPDNANDKYFNSAVLVGPDGKEIAQYDKIYLVPFGESVPAPLQSIVPAFVGSFSYGSEHDLLPLGEAKAGVMICFESHFGELSREYVRNGADVIIEMTNDGYLGPTPVLRQHLANAVFRAVETNRPLLRVTNVGITAYISERGAVIEPTESYSEATRVWSVGRSDGSQTFYVRYGDWFGWLCSIVMAGQLLFAFFRRRSQPLSND